jgi:hypothetical protein
MKKIAAFSAALIVGTFAASSFADQTQPASPAVVRGENYQTTDADGPSYSVNFLDDILQAPGAGSGVPLIRVRPPSGRATLIRPRVQFVQELYKSVEDI